MKNKVKTKEEKIWGIYPAFIKKEELDKLDEFEIWKKIYNLSRSAFCYSTDTHKVWNNNILLSDIDEVEYALEYLIYYTRNFGVEFDIEPTATSHIPKSISYINWFKYWEEYFNLLIGKKDYTYNIPNKVKCTKKKVKRITVKK